MTKQQLLHELENMMEIEPDSLTGQELLSSLSQWDSMTVLSFIMLVEEKLDFVVDGDDVSRAETIDDLLDLPGDRVKT